ncbi:MAG: response regulator [bacterium]
MDRRYKILIVEDEVTLGMAMTIMLNKDYDILTAESVKEARLLFDSCPDLILTDIRLPGVIGAEFINELNETFIDKPIIAMSCLPEQDIIDELMQSGITAIIRKPFTKEEILRLIRESL